MTIQRELRKTQRRQQRLCPPPRQPERRPLRGRNFAMRSNDAYDVTPYHSATDLGQVPSYHEATGDDDYDDIVPFNQRMLATSNDNH